MNMKKGEYHTMPSYRFLPNKMRILSGSALKLIAVITMLIDHIASHLVPKTWVLFSVFGIDVTLYRAMRNIGRWAFPIFCILMIEGFLHTRNRVRYGGSLLLFALLSEIPWNLVHSGTWLYAGQNIFFTLFLGYLGICAMEYLPHFLLKMGALAALAAASVVLRVDYSVAGYAFIVLLYALRENELARPLTAFLLTNHWWTLSAFIPISLYNGKRGFVKNPVLKYAFYVFYPLHLFVIYLIKFRVLA